MKSFNVYFLLIVLFTSTTLFAKESRGISEIVDKYYRLKALKMPKNMSLHPCYPHAPGCFKTACKTVGGFECDDPKEMEVLRRACRGVYGGQCILTSIKYLSRFKYDEIEEMAELANSCRGVYDVDCLTYTCDTLGRFRCDELDEITAINMSCSGVN